MCGKDCGSWVVPATFSGSPPHVRERPANEILRDRYGRITPACAGKTSILIATRLLG